MTGYKDTVGAHMTRSPKCIALTDNLQQASDVMRDMGIRHIPVLEQGRPVGMLSERDLALATAFSDRPIEKIQVLEAMAQIPYCVPPETPVRVVAKHLADRKLDAALVIAGSRILGVFTTTDALQLLATVLSHDRGEDDPERMTA